MARGVTIAELLAAFAAAITSVFDGSDWAVWPQPPDQTAVPAVWPELSSSSTGASPTSAATVAVRVVAAIAPKTSAAEYSAIADAHDRLDQIKSPANGVAIAGRQAFLDQVDIGQIPHTALMYVFTVDRPRPC